MEEGPEGFLRVSRGPSEGISLICICVLLSLTGGAWGGEEGRVSYEPVGQFSSRGSIKGNDNGEDGGEKSSVSKLWWTRFQSCCTIYSAMIARGMT